MYLVADVGGTVPEPTRDGAQAFCERYYRTLVGSLALYVADPLLAEELAQEAMLRAFRRWERVAVLDSPEGWVWRVAVNLANSHFRRRRVARRARRRLQAGQANGHVGPDVAWQVSIQQAVAGLPDRQREAVILRYFHDLPVGDTAAAMGISEDAVRSLTKRGVAALRAEFAPDTTENADG